MADYIAWFQLLIQATLIWFVRLYLLWVCLPCWCIQASTGLPPVCYSYDRPDVSRLFPHPLAGGSAVPRCVISRVLDDLQLCSDYSFRTSQVSDIRSQHTHKVNVYRAAQNTHTGFYSDDRPLVENSLTLGLMNMCDFGWRRCNLKIWIFDLRWGGWNKRELEK